MKAWQIKSGKSLRSLNSKRPSKEGLCKKKFKVISIHAPGQERRVVADTYIIIRSAHICQACKPSPSGRQRGKGKLK